MLSQFPITIRFQTCKIFLANLHGYYIFSKVDFIRVYHQISMNPNNIPKAAVYTPLGSFELLSMPFGLQKTTSTSQRFIDKIVHGLNFVFPYVDDLLITSDMEQNHLQHLPQLFQWLCAYGVPINPGKCIF